MERQPPSRKESIRELNQQFKQLTQDLATTIKDAGAHSASLELRNMHPEIDWSAYPNSSQLELIIDEEKASVFGIVTEAINNRKEAHLLEHQRELEAD